MLLVLLEQKGCLGLQKKKLREKPWSWLLFVRVCLTFLYQMGKKIIFFSCDVAEQVHGMLRGAGVVFKKSNNLTHLILFLVLNSASSILPRM